MKKIIIAFDGDNFSESACRFAGTMNEEQSILLIGVFLPKVGFSLMSTRMSLSNAENLIDPEEDREIKVLENINRFKSFCSNRHIHYKVHKDIADLALPELRKESRFADLLILGMESYYQGFGERGPGEYLEETLAHAECPVLLVPDSFGNPHTNVIAYDGGESSVFAMKEFARLFPYWTENKTLLVYADSDEHTEIPEKTLLAELAAGYFQQSECIKLGFDPHKFFNTWLSGIKDPILVSGAFGRSGLSRFFKKSFLVPVIEEHKVPLFITHK